MAALPADSEIIDKLAKHYPKDELLGENEIWVLADTGANVSAMKVDRDCPQYAHLVKATANSKKGTGAESACGGAIKERGEVLVDCTIDGEKFQIPFRDMDVTMPLASMRRVVRSGHNQMVIEEGGGHITNLISKKRIRLYERKGVYFFKAKILPPGSVGPSESPFTRRA